MSFCMGAPSKYLVSKKEFQQLTGPWTYLLLPLENLITEN